MVYNGSKLHVWPIEYAVNASMPSPLRQLNVDQEELKALRNPQLCPQGSEVWLDARKLRLGPSEVAQAIGCSPYGKTPKDLIAVKQSDCTPQPTAAQQYGIRHEQEAVDEFLQLFNSTYQQLFRDTGDQHYNQQVVAETTGVWISPDQPHLCASPDRILRFEDGCVMLLEVKCYQQDPGQELPQHVFVQVSCQSKLSLHTARTNHWVGDLDPCSIATQA